jgi:hypothetical protein
VVAKGIRTDNNACVLKEDREECHLRKHDESWLWHRRFGHLNFDHLIKLKNLEAVKDLPKLSKPQDSVCKPCQVGKLTRTRFKSKELYFNRETTPISSYGFMWTIKDRKADH